MTISQSLFSGFWNFIPFEPEKKKLRTKLSFVFTYPNQRARQRTSQVPSQPRPTALQVALHEGLRWSKLPFSPRHHTRTINTSLTKIWILPTLPIFYKIANSHLWGSSGCWDMTVKKQRFSYNNHWLTDWLTDINVWYVPEYLETPNLVHY